MFDDSPSCDCFDFSEASHHRGRTDAGEIAILCRTCDEVVELEGPA